MGNCHCTTREEYFEKQYSFKPALDIESNPLTNKASGLALTGTYKNQSYFMKKFIFHDKEVSSNIYESTDIIEKTHEIHTTKFLTIKNNKKPIYIIIFEKIKDRGYFSNSESVIKFLNKIFEVFIYMTKNGIIKNNIDQKNVYLYLSELLIENSPDGNQPSIKIFMKNLLEDVAYVAPELNQGATITTGLNFQKCIVFSVGVLFLNLCGYHNIEGINGKSHPKIIDQAINFMRYRYKKEQFCVIAKLICQYNPNLRPDFHDLSIACFEEDIFNFNNIDLLWQASGLNDPNAQCALANLYNESFNHKSCFTSFSWYEAASVQGHIESKYKLGVCYFDGLGCRKDVEKAAILFQEICAVYIDAEAMLGYLYLLGSGINKDKIKGRKLLESAARRGSIVAFHNIGKMYELALFFPVSDVNKAREWYLIATEANYPPSQNALGQLELPNYQAALDWFFQAYYNGDHEAKFHLAFMYMNGFGVVQNYAKSLSLYLQAAEEGYTQAFVNIATFFLKGYGVRRNIEKAIEYLIECGKLGSSVGYLNLGDLFLEGNYIKQDPNMAIWYYEKAALLGDYYAMVALQNLYEKNDYVERNLELANIWRKRAIKKQLENYNFQEL